MKEILRKYFVYIVIIVLSLYVLPLLIQDTGSAMAVLLTYIPIIVFVTSFIFGIKNHFPYVLPAIVAVLFVPTIFIYYNFTAIGYILGYYLISLVGVALGQLLRKLKVRKEKND